MKTNKLSISQLKQSLKKSDWNEFITVFNQIHNKHLNSSVGTVQIKTNDKKKINK